MDYHEIPDAFPDDVRDYYPTVARACLCDHDETEHDYADGVCLIRGCNCVEFRDRLEDDDE